MPELAARGLALELLDELDRSKNLALDPLLESAADRIDRLDHRDRQLLYHLVFGATRWRKRIDWIIARFSRTPLNRLNPSVRNGLRLGIYQIFWLDRIPDTAAVDTTVKLIKKRKPPHIAGFVNGTLRNIVRNKDAIAFPDYRSEPAAALAVRKSMPEWLVRRWLDRFGFEETRTLCDAMNTIAALCLRTNTLKTTRPALIDRLVSADESAALDPVVPEGIRLTSPRAPVEALPGYAEGWFAVQDSAAQLVAHLLDPRPGERILDACAGLGGKTGHIAQRMENRGTVTAIDHRGDRLEKLQSEMNRLGITIVSPLCADLEKPPALPVFDRVLLDAPCSGLGVLRRNPDTRWHRTEPGLHRYATRQLAMLEALAPLVKRDGILVYAVCSMEPEENEAVIDGFTRRYPAFRIEPAAAFSLLPPESTGPDRRFFRAYPHRHDCDGFFAAVLKRT